jgi:ABC-2 type transport system ATP-binding protein
MSPARGLDPGAAEQLLEAMIEAAAEGSTVFFSTHQISEAERVADHVFIMNSGQLVFESALEAMRENYRRISFVFPGRAPVESIQQLGRALGAISIEAQPISLREVFLESSEEDRS